MATGEFDIIYANALPAATNVTDNDMILIIQGGRPKRALPSTMKGRPGDPGLSVYLGVDATSILWKQGPSGTWQNLISLEKIRGPKGEKPLFRKVEGTLQLKYENEPDSAYKSIFDREELKMKFSDLTAEERDLLRLHYSDLTGPEKAELMKPATDAAKAVTDKMAQIEQDANQKIADLTTFETTAKEQEADRVDAEKKRKAEEGIRKTDEATRKSDFEKIKTDAGEATENANASAANADEKAGLANTAADLADKATKNADDAAGAANRAAEQAITEAGKATDAAELAEEKAGLANTVAELAKRSAANADEKAKEAEKQADLASKATGNTDKATKNANDATGAANDAAELAKTAARNATDAAVLAEEKAGVANAAAELATSSAVAAQETADHPTYVGDNFYVYKWNKETKAYDKTNVFVKGDGFSVKKVYPSIPAMNADLDNPDIKEGDFVLINTNDVEDPDNAQLYTRTETGFNFLVDMSGPIGFTGKTPQFSIGNVSKGDEPVASLSPDGTDTDGNPQYKLNIVLPQGDTGKVGPVGPVGPEGKQGPIGPKGDTGAAFTYDMFTPEQLALLVGPVGPIGSQGPKGDTGATGPAGAKGATGPQGPAGARGATGPAGANGSNGVSCDWQWSGTSLRVYGASGWSDYVNLKGATGDRGATGATGPQGPTGATGAQGPRGYTGSTGAQGPKGDKGDKGDTGARGATGVTGPQGPKGADGVFAGGTITKTIAANFADAFIRSDYVNGGGGLTSSRTSISLYTGQGSAKISFINGGTEMFYTTSGIVAAAKSVTVVSDMTLKNKIRDFDSVLDKIDKLNPFYFYYKDDEPDNVYGGLSAQELLTIYPEFVRHLDDHYSVDYGSLTTCIAIRGIQELLARIESLEQKISA